MMEKVYLSYRKIIRSLPSKKGGGLKLKSLLKLVFLYYLNFSLQFPKPELDSV